LTKKVNYFILQENFTLSTLFFPWKDAYSVSVIEIDSQHKVIIEMLNELYDSFMKKEHELKLGEILSRLSDYAIYHFETEEKYFSRFSYSKRTAHIKEHNDFTEKIKVFRKEFDKNSSALTYKLINFLREWLMNHILVSDKDYVKCFKENGLM
jgi:hemerythrin